MIVEMKKVYILCMARDRDDALSSLGDLGVLHIVPTSPPDSPDLQAAKRNLELAETAQRILENFKLPPDETMDLRPSEKTTESGSSVVERVHTLTQHNKSVSEERENLLTEKSKIEDFGDFDPAMATDLATRGIHTRLYRARSQNPVKTPPGTQMIRFPKGKSGSVFAVIGQGDFELDAEEVPLPERSLSTVLKEIASQDAKLAETDAEIRKMATTELHAVRQRTAKCAADLAYLHVRDGMGSSDEIIYLQAFCPADRLDAVRHEAQARGWGVFSCDPTGEDTVPTLIRNPAWVRPIQSVFSMIGIMPGYKEVDISALFLIFLTGFFAILVGDAGYGLIFLGLTVFFRKKFRQAPPEPFRLLTLFSLATLVWGAMTGNYFGIQPGILPAPLQGLRVTFLSADAVGQAKADSNFMALTFLIGATHLTLAHLWNMIRTINSTKALAQLGWIAITWTMFFAAQMMVLDKPFPPLMKWVFVAGVILVALFMTTPRELKTEWTGHVMLPLTIISNFVDVVSYVRLFAVGSASLAVAVAFNDMAMAKGFNGILAGLGAALIIFGGHVLNIILCGMSILVHGIRLNTLEFSSHVGMQWTGFPYTPFAIANRQTKASEKQD